MLGGRGGEHCNFCCCCWKFARIDCDVAIVQHIAYLVGGWCEGTERQQRHKVDKQTVMETGKRASRLAKCSTLFEKFITTCSLDGDDVECTGNCTQQPVGTLLM